MIRRSFFAVILIAIWLGVLAWDAGLSWRTPLVPRLHQALAGYDFHARFGSADRAGEGLQVRALGEDGTGLQTAMTVHFVAADVPILRYRIADFPRTLELAVVFRRSDAPEDVQTISLPSPGSAEAVVDLSSLAEWRGEITEFGFAEYATAQLVPPSAAVKFVPFTIVRAELQSSAWSQLVPRLRTDWFAYRPWALRSINTLGAPIETLRSSSMQATIGVGALLSLLAAALLFRLSRQRVGLAAAVAVLVAWVLLDLRWLDELQAKHGLTETIYGGKPWAQREALQPDEAAFEAARQVVRLARDAKAGRVLVASGSPYAALRFGYFLRPLNVIDFDEVARSAHPMPPDALVALFDSDWHFDAATSTLKTPQKSYSMLPVFEQGALRVYRVREGTP